MLTALSKASMVSKPLYSMLIPSSLAIPEAKSCSIPIGS
ncbi:Uncharacterised protein [Vibrio cholerae]|nr:Uncharacterised protein [Vibrio cholerae]